ncbi:MAG: molybdopterin-dependent oxidoreductase [Candidatus Eremiobacteraeota bacterium]|nr:molybdopterin-dependent oxidoreductase [Candidatus Eremiobacteraeota bacterium]
MKRKLFIASSLSAALAGCSAIGTKLNNNPHVHSVIDSAEGLNRALIGTHGLAKEYAPGDISSTFPVDSLPTPSNAYYARIVKDHFASFTLVVDGAVAHPQKISYAGLQHMRRATNITRHDCVEGWSAIAQWSGVPLRDILALAKPRDDAKYVVFHCMDVDDQGTIYYESLDLQQARHPQALLALQMNGRTILPEHGAPVRLRVPTQLGYKSAKWIRRIEVVGSLGSLYGGAGGYWEDQGYEWYAGV